MGIDDFLIQLVKYCTLIVAVTVLVAVSITEVVLLPEFVIYAYGPAGKALCALATNAVDDKETKNKKNKTIEKKFSLFFIYLPLCSVYLSNLICRCRVQISSTFPILALFYRKYINF